MPDTFFTTPPDWTWWIVPYFFIGGISGGALALGGMLHLVGREADRPVIRLAYYVAFIGAVISGFLLVVDLHRPTRFWHMLLQSETLRPIFKWYSPMSFGSWTLLLFSLVALLLALGALHESGRMRRSWLQPLSRGLLANLLAAGEFGLLINTRPESIDELKQKGAPLEWVAPRPTTANVLPIAVAKNAPHPNAARLFMDYMLSDEGQKRLSAMSRTPARPGVPATNPRLSQGLEIAVNDPGMAERFDQVVQLYRQVFGVQ